MEKEIIPILLIEDNPADILLLREALEEVTFFSSQLTVAEHLEQGIQMLSEQPFGAILLDLGLPDSQGLDTFQKVHMQKPDVPVIVLSGMDDDRLAFEAVQAGAQDYLVKGKVGGETIARATRYAIERQRSKVALRESENRFRSLFEHSPVAYQSLDLEGIYIDVNSQLCELLGYGSQELLGKSFGDFWSPETRNAFLRNFERLKQDGELSSEIRLIKKDGTPIDVIAEGRIEYDLDGNIVKTHCILHDITVRKLTEQANRESRERFGKIFHASPISIFITTTDEIILDVNEAFLDMFGYKRSQVLNRTMGELNLWSNQQENHLLIELLGQQGGVSNHEIKYRTSSGEIGDALAFVDLIELAGKQCLLVMLNDITERIRAESNLRRTRKFLQGVQDSLSAHIAILDQEGVIKQVNKAWRDFGEKNDYDHPEYGVGVNYLEICDSAAGINSEEGPIVAAAIWEVLAGEQDYAQIEYPCHSQEEKRWFVLHITSFEEQGQRWVVLAHENITQRKEAENASRLAGEHFRALIENAPDGIVLIDAEGKFKYISPSAKKKFGYEADEEVGMNPSEATHPDDLPTVLTLLNELIKNPDLLPTVQYRFRHKNGTWIWIESTFSNLLAEPSVGAIVINFREITERKKSEAALLESEARFSTVFHSSPLSIAITRLSDNLLLDVNKAWLDLTGYQRGEVISHNPKVLNLWVDPEDREQVIRSIQNQGTLRNFECQMRKKSGEVANLLFSAELIDLKGESCMLSMALDITQRVQIEENNRFQAELLDAVGQAVIATQPDGKISYLNKAASELYGWDFDEAIGFNIMDVTVPKISEKEADTILTELMDGRPWSGEFVAQRKDKSTFIADVIDTPVINTEGELTAIIGVSSDITRRKQAEKHFNELSAFNEKVLNNSPIGIITYKLSGECTFANENAAKIVGTSIEQLKTQNFHEIESWKQSGLLELVEKAIQTNEIVTADVYHESTFGKNIWMTVNCVTFTSKEEEHLLLTFTDISERKLAIRQIEQLKDFNESIVQTMTEGIVMEDQQGNFTFLNPAACDLLGYTSKELVGKNWAELLPPDQQLIVQMANERRMRREADRYELEVVHKDGKRISLLVSGSPRFDVEDNFIGTIAVFSDISERVRADDERNKLLHDMGERVKEIRCLYGVAESIRTRTTLKEIFQDIVDLIPNGWQYPDITRSKVIFDGQIHVSESFEETNWKQASDILVNGKVRGSIEVFILEERPELDEGPFLEEERELINEIAKLVGDAFERKQAEQSLTQSEERYRTLIDQIPAIVYIDDVVSKPGRTKFISPYVQQMLGFSPDEWINAGFELWEEQLHPDDRERVLSEFRSAVKSASVLNCEYRLFAKDGRLVWVRDQAIPLNDKDGKPHSIQGIIQDITERKLSEQALRESEQRFRMLFTISPDAILVFNPHDEEVVWPIIDCNKAACVMNGYTREELIGQSVDMLNSIPETRVEHNAYLEQVKSEGVVRLETIHRHKDGHLFPIEVSTSTFTFEGRELVLGIDRDISERKRTEREIKRHVAELETLYENGLLISGLLDPKKIAQRIVKVLEHNLNWHHVAIRLYNSEKDRMELLALSQAGSDPSENQEQMERISKKIRTPDQGLSGWVVRHASPVRSGNLHDDPRYLPTFPGLSSGLYVPILAGDVAIGSIAVESEVENAFTDQDERLLITLANQAAISFENANLYFRLQQELSERRQAENRIRKLNIELEQRVAARTAEIRKAHQRMELAAAAAGIGIWELRANSDKLVWDEGVHKIYGTSPSLSDDLTITKWLEFIHPDDRQRIKRKWAETLEQNIPYQEEFRIIRSDGSLRYISSHAIILRDDDHAYKGSVGVNMDITTIKRAEETLRMANMELARALKVKDEFLANMSHELRTPLNAILGLSESLEEQIAGPLNEKQQKYLHTIGESGHHLLTLINDILDLAKIGAGQIELDINKVNIQLVCQASVRMIKQMAQKKQQHVAVEIDERVDLIYADERRLKQMIVNLLSNAVKFTPNGGKIGIKIVVKPSENTILITVWDTGIGIKKDDFERLFKPFVQLDASLNRESPGTGLGLALVAQMARMHGGRLEVKSVPGEGSRFTIALPWKSAVATGSLAKHQTGNLGNRTVNSTESKQTILLVEDTDAVVMMLKDYLEKAGYQMLVARDGLEGIAQARRVHPDLIIMDVMMPGLDGLEATRRIRNEPELVDIPIVGLTALAMPNDRERCLAAGMNGYLSKPVVLNELVSVIQEHLPVQEEAKT